MRVLGRAVPLVTLFVACLPTDPCSCLVPPGVAEVVGEVQRVDSTPATDALTWYVIYEDTACAITRVTGAPVPVDDAAAYQHRVFTELDRRQCVAVYAAPPGAAGRSDSTRATRIHTFRYREPPDTLAMPVIRLLH